MNFVCIISCWGCGVEVSNCNYDFFSFIVYLCFMYFEALLVGSYTFRISKGYVFLLHSSFHHYVIFLFVSNNFLCSEVYFIGYYTFVIFLQFLDIVLFCSLCISVLEVSTDISSSLLILSSAISPLDEPRKVILHFFQCFWFLAFIFDSFLEFPFSAYISHLFLHVVLFFSSVLLT